MDPQLMRANCVIMRQPQMRAGSTAERRAYLFYFKHQVGADAEGKPAGWKRHTVIQVAELQLQDGILRCDRNKPVNIDLSMTLRGDYASPR